MQKWILFFIFLSSFYRDILAQNVTSSPSFPEAWLGVWEGELDIYNGQKVVQKVKIKMENLATDTADIYSWILIYGEDEVAGKRDYLLRAVNKEKGHWEVDEKNAIFLDGYVVSNQFISTFLVQNNLITSIISKEDENTLIFEIIVHNNTPNRKTGNTKFQEENIPEVTNYPTIGYQYARLSKKMF
ncbi:MAG: hypothetical protein WAT79_11700 [Saprospiraceae bacterium]